jgi:hypothetical protein
VIQIRSGQQRKQRGREVGGLERESCCTTGETYPQLKVGRQIVLVCVYLAADVSAYVFGILCCPVPACDALKKGGVIVAWRSSISFDCSKNSFQKY